MDGWFWARCRALVFALIAFPKVLGLFLQLVISSEWQLCHPALSSTPPVCCPLWAFWLCVLFHSAWLKKTCMLELITFLRSQAVLVMGHQVALEPLTIILWVWLSSPSLTCVVFQPFSQHLPSLASRVLWETKSKTLPNLVWKPASVLLSFRGVVISSLKANSVVKLDLLMANLGCQLYEPGNGFPLKLFLP